MTTASKGGNFREPLLRKGLPLTLRVSNFMTRIIYSVWELGESIECVWLVKSGYIAQNLLTRFAWSSWIYLSVRLIKVGIFLGFVQNTEIAQNQAPEIIKPSLITAIPNPLRGCLAA